MFDDTHAPDFRLSSATQHELKSIQATIGGTVAAVPFGRVSSFDSRDQTPALEGGPVRPECRCGMFQMDVSWPTRNSVNSALITVANRVIAQRVP